MIFTEAFIEISQHQQLKDFFGEFNIFRGFVPEETLNDVRGNLPLACLYDISNVDKNFASDKSHKTEGILQISVWAEDFETLDELAGILVEIMPEMGYGRIFFHTQFDGDFNIPQLVIRYKYAK